jgi:hypothetical protein
MNRYDKNHEIYVIPMHRKDVWTNKWMQDPRKKLLQVSSYDPSVQYRRGWGSFKRKKGSTLYYSCIRIGHLAKEFLGIIPRCLCCKAMDHEVLDCPRMIAKLESMNIRQEKPKPYPETKAIAECQKESEKALLHMKDTLDDHRHLRLSYIFKDKEFFEARIGDFDIDYVLDEDTQVNIMTKRTWESIGRNATIPSLGGIGLFRGKLVKLCVKLAQIPMNINGTSTEEDFEIIKFIEDIAPFTMLIGKPWIDRAQAKRKEEEEASKQKKQDLKDFMARRITQLIEEQEKISKLVVTRNIDVKATRTLGDPKKTEVHTPNKEEVLPLNPRKQSQQRTVTMLKDNKNQNGKEATKMKLTGKKARNLSKKRAKIGKLQNIPEGTSKKENL